MISDQIDKSATHAVLTFIFSGNFTEGSSEGEDACEIRTESAAGASSGIPQPGVEGAPNVVGIGGGP